MDSVRGVVFAIHRGAIHDGPGLRTAVFLKGCPLRCEWCHNPESMRREPETAQAPGPDGRCETVGERMTVGEVMASVLPDAAYYRASGGGMTLTGGEPTLQAEFCEALLRAAREVGIHTCLDTSGQMTARTLQRMLPLVDLFLFDVKATGEARHRQLTGVGPGTIEDRLAEIGGAGAAVRLRCPLVPGVNDQDEHFERLAALLERYPSIEGVDLLPYHAAGAHKRARFGYAEPHTGLRVPTEVDRARWQSFAIRLRGAALR